MDVADTRVGMCARDRDDMALSVQNVFKRFLEEYSANEFEEAEDQSMDLDASEQDADVTNESFSSARSSNKPSKTKRRPFTGPSGKAKYAEEALLLLTNERNTLFIDFKDVELFDSNLAEDIISEYYRFYPYLCRALASYVREEKIRQTEADLDPNADVSERIHARDYIKKDLDRPQIRNKDYYVGFYNFAHRVNIRDLSCTKIGTLTRVSGQVVRTHSVHPELIIGCFRCKDCLSIKYTEQQFRYTPPTTCSNENCANRTRYELILENSRFTDFQRLRIQETQQELPRGCIPRSFDVVVRGADQVECIQPGDQCDFIGTLLAIPDLGQMITGSYGTVFREQSTDAGVVGLKSTGVREVTYSLAFLANACIIEGQHKPSVNTDLHHREVVHGSELDVKDFTEEEIMKIERMSKDSNLLDNLSQSLFSSIYGSDDVKKGIILQLLGGVSKVTETGTKLRGDINICLVGDPSTAKSQFLKIVTDFAPVKAVYASGKGSSSSGLTAAVVRDHDGGFVIEAGALMLADRGICCIDEFDKMDTKDQVAIHEAMEQQTISITKAGVTATLNARTSILAAANPIGGTYNTNRDLRSNLSLSLPIMSRFDLFFTIIDPQDEENDRAIGSRILDMHLNYANPESLAEDMIYSFEDIRLYLRFARKYYPKIPINSESLFVREFIRLRSGSTRSRTSWRITIRQLESLIRLSEAIARGHCSSIVKPEYIKMASRLIEKTIVHVGKTEVDLDEVKEELATQEPFNSQVEPEVDSQMKSEPLSQKQHLTIDLANYRGMAEVLMTKLRHESEREDRESPALKRSELIDWYLHQCLDEIATEKELLTKKQLCEKVLDRLIKVDQILMEIREDGVIVDHDKEQGDEDRLIIINPELDDLESDEFFSQINL